MAVVSSRQGLIDWAKRQLGAPVVQINVDDDQVSDRVDEAIQYYRDYHMDATELTYLKYQITQTEVDQRYIDITRASGTVSVLANSANVYGAGTIFTEEMKNGSAVITVNGETKQVIGVTNTSFMTVNTAFVNSATNVNLYVPKTDDAIISVERIVTLGGDAGNPGNMFDIQYQFRLNELYDLVSVSYTNYFITMTHMRNLQLLFTGEKPMRFNRHVGRIYMDMNIPLVLGQFLIFECYRAVDFGFTGVYNDLWLKRATTCLIKKQWGTNLKKYSGVALIGGVQMNGQAIYDEAQAEWKDLFDELKDGHQFPPMFIVG
jgi:hypothetical protein